MRRDSLFPRFVLLLLFIGAFALRTIGIGVEGLWRDEVDAVRFALEPLPQVLARFTEPGFNGPLYHLLLRGWLNLAGVNDFALRYLSVVCGMLLVALMFVVARRVHGNGIFAALFAAASPVLVWYSGEGKMYSMQPLVLALALYALLRAVGMAGIVGARRWWIVFVAATLVSFGLHILSPLFLAVVVVAVVFGVRRWDRRAFVLIGVLGVVLLPFAPYVVGRVGQFLAGGGSGHPAYSLAVIVQTLMANWVVGLDAGAPFVPSTAPEFVILAVRWLVIGLFLALALWGAFAPHVRRAAVVIAAWLLLPALILYLVSLRVPLFEPRYVLWSAPALYVLADMGLQRLLKAGLSVRAIACCSLLLTVLLFGGVLAQRVRPIRPAVREAVTEIGRELQPGDGVVFQIPYMVYSFDYYLRNDPQRAYATSYDGPFTNAQTGEDEVDALLAPMLDFHTRIWLLESESAMWDERGLTRAWFDAHAHLVRRDELRGATVSLYAIE
ncbi:MAG: glycosyltransferase family 39 protein [Chloroflexi bacterium]|nr:glycosyltransferase family 39 protein [Chloroflexota bacterium]